MNDKLVCETGIGFSKRDNNVKSEEEKGNLEFKVVRNDGSDENLRILTDLKNIIAKQLPKMPKEYIVRLVFDRKHESMVIQKSNLYLTIGDGKVVGGVCYRPNPTQNFIEIAFLAISSIEQVKGYGTRLMNKLKDHCKTKGLQYFLTYADNNAIGYFKKQGFSTMVKMSLDQWKE
jgi:histone acetyltransferase